MVKADGTPLELPEEKQDEDDLSEEKLTDEEIEEMELTEEELEEEKLASEIGGYLDGIVEKLESEEEGGESKSQKHSTSNPCF